MSSWLHMARQEEYANEETEKKEKMKKGASPLIFRSQHSRHIADTWPGGWYTGMSPGQGDRNWLPVAKWMKLAGISVHLARAPHMQGLNDSLMLFMVDERDHNSNWRRRVSVPSFIVFPYEKWRRILSNIRIRGCPTHPPLGGRVGCCLPQFS